MINIAYGPKGRDGGGREKINGFEIIQLLTKTADETDAIMQFNENFQVLLNIFRTT